MVTSIHPGNIAGTGLLGVDPRSQRAGPSGAPPPSNEAALGDRVEISGAALSAARESVRAGISQIHEALAIGHEAQSLLVKTAALARNPDANAQAELDGALAAFTRRIEAAKAGGAVLPAGGEISVQAEPGAPPVTVKGVDLGLKNAPGYGDVMLVPAQARVDAPGLARDAQRSLENLQEAMGKLIEAARALEAHQGFLGVAESAVASGVRADLDAEGARLLALQVRQGLQASGGAAIANAEPQAVLALFRA